MTKLSDVERDLIETYTLFIAGYNVTQAAGTIYSIPVKRAKKM